MRVLVLNTGSSSVRWEVLEVAVPADGAADPDAAGGSDEASLGEGRQEEVADHEDALRAVMDQLRDEGLLEGIAAVGHRMVHGGERFTAPTVVDDDVVAALEELSPLAPLHNPPALAGIAVARRLLPDLPHVAVFDTAFHATLPPAAFRYAVPSSWYADHGVRRYGFHGTSHAYVAGEAARALGRPLADLRLITLHLGNGASACAVAGGRSVATTMGLTPLEGLVMGTRSGDLDPGVVFHMVRAGMAVEEVEAALNRESGLRGLAGASDMRSVRAAADEGDPDAVLAIQVAVGRIRRVVGAYAVELGGLDAVVFTAGIGEHDAALREEVLEGLGVLGLAVDEAANGGCDASAGPVVISPAGRSPVALVVATDEERMIAREAARAVT